MEPTLTADLWVAAYIRRLASQAVPAFVARRGERTAGAVLLRLNGLAGSSLLLERARRADGRLIWLKVLGSEPCPDAQCDAHIARAVGRDPDLWVIEVEDRAMRHFLDEPVE
ncbi:MAG: DUF1491 family protein [Alphaproteobacteria bacterium]|nr:DUF1491 family protein [Alphaproteobacteria bacterium]